MSLKLLLIGQAGSHMDSYKADLCSLCKALSITVHYQAFYHLRPLTIKVESFFALSRILTATGWPERKIPVLKQFNLIYLNKWPL